MMFIVILMLIACIAGLAAFAAFYLSAGYRREYLEEENRRLRLLLEKTLLTERDFQEACAAMLREAGRGNDGEFWDDDSEDCGSF